MITIIFTFSLLLNLRDATNRMLENCVSYQYSALPILNTLNDVLIELSHENFRQFLNCHGVRCPFLRIGESISFFFRDYKPL